MELIFITGTFLLTIIAIVLSIRDGITKKDRRWLFESALILLLSILSLVFMVFYIFIAEAGPSEPPNTLLDYVTVGILCVLWTIGMYLGFSFLNGRLMKLSVFSQLSLSYLFVIIGMLGSINKERTGLDGILIIRIICTGVITLTIILMMIKAIKQRSMILNIRKE